MVCVFSDDAWVSGVSTHERNSTQTQYTKFKMHARMSMSVNTHITHTLHTHSNMSLHVTMPTCIRPPLPSTNLQRGFQALHTAVYNRRQPVVEFLIKEGKCHVDTPTSHQEVPLHLACLRGDVSMVTFLLGCNAECACQDTNGNTCLHYAAAGNCADVVRCIVSRHGEMKDLKNKVCCVPYVCMCVCVCAV